MDFPALHRPGFDAPPTQAEFDALTDLFLGDGAHAPTPARPRLELVPEPSPELSREARADRLIVEAVVRGHLPVFGAPWVAQHAAQVARDQNQPVALARIAAGYAEVEVHFPPGAPPALRLDGLDPIEALAAAASLARRWLLHVDEPFEPDLWTQPTVSGVVLLSGVDQAALVNAYRVLKEVARSTPPEFGLRIAFMGAAPDRAADAGQRIARAARSFLNRRVEFTPSLARLGPAARSVRIGAIAADSTSRFLDLIQLAARINADVPTAVATVTGEHTAPSTASTPSAPQAPHAPRDDLTLAEFIGELSPLTLRCPYAPGVELAVAADGRLHLLARSGGESTCGAPQTQGRALEQLTTTSAWALAHAGLLAVSRAGLRLDHEHLPILHLVTDRPRDARRLLESEIRVHLLARAEPSRPWICRDLN